MRIFQDLEEFIAADGEELGHGDWMVVDQDRIERFADATDDQQWIHVDPARASDGPFGTTIAHGYLTLSLLPRLLRSVYRIEGLSLAVNYGLDRVRFPAPVPSGSRIRARTRLDSVIAIPDGCRAVLDTTVEIEDGPRPGAVIRSVVQYVG